jgi:hypothetical protein
MAGDETLENDRASAQEEMNREATRLPIIPQGEIRRRAEDQLREKHDAVVARIMRTHKDELTVASPNDRAEIKEQHALELVGTRRLLDLEVRKAAAGIESAYLSHELDERRPLARAATGRPALERRHAIEEMALDQQHVDDIGIMRAEQEASVLDASQWHAELADLAKLHDKEWSNLIDRQRLEAVRDAETHEPTRKIPGRTSRRGSNRGKSDDIER